MREPKQVIHDSLQEWNTEEFVELNWNMRAAQQIIKDLDQEGYTIVPVQSKTK